MVYCIAECGQCAQLTHANLWWRCARDGIGHWEGLWLQRGMIVEKVIHVSCDYMYACQCTNVHFNIPLSMQIWQDACVCHCTMHACKCWPLHSHSCEMPPLWGGANVITMQHKVHSRTHLRGHASHILPLCKPIFSRCDTFSLWGRRCLAYWHPTPNRYDVRHAHWWIVQITWCLQMWSQHYCFLWCPTVRGLI